MDFHVDTLQIVCMILNGIICFGIPVGMLIFLKWKKNANIWPFFAGCIVFVMFALILESIINVIVSNVLKVAGIDLGTNIWLYGIYGGLAAGLFEETGRYWAMYLYMRKNPKPVNALMYGAGHGGIEAILLVGINYIVCAIISIMINGGLLAQLSSQGVSPELILQLTTQFSALTPFLCLMAGIERIMAMALHCILSILVYRAVLEKKIVYYLISIGIHALVNCVVVWTASLGSIAIAEMIMFVMMIAITIYGAYQYRALKQQYSNDEED